MIGALVATYIIALSSLLLLACGGGATAPQEAVDELRRLAPFEEGRPVLVFVYTDG